MVRILHIGLGPLGRRVLADFVARRMGTVAAAVDLAPDIAGQSVEAVVPGAGGAVVARDIEELGDLAAIDCALVTTSSGLEACADTFRALLARGVDVVSSCEELSYPWLRHRVLAQELHERAVRGGARIVGTGVNPGFVMDTLPVFLSGVCNEVRRIDVWRIQDASTRRIPFQRKIGAGLDPTAFAAAAAEGTLRHVGLGESLHLVANALGFQLDAWDEQLEPVLADRELECGLGRIARGHAAGVRQVAEGRADGACVVRLVFQAAIGQPEPHDRVRIDGDPPLDVVLKNGVHGDIATSAVLLNTIAALRAAAPGLHTTVTLRPAHSRAGSSGS